MKKKKQIIVGGILIALAPMILITGTMYSLMLPLMYAGTSIVQFDFPENHQQQYTSGALLGLTRQKAELIKTSSILHSVIEELDLNHSWGREGDPLPPEVTRKILHHSVETVADNQALGLIRIIVRRNNPVEASEIANALASAYEQSEDSISIVDIAQPNRRPVSPNLFLDVILSLAQAIVIGGIGVALLVFGLRKRKPNQPSQIVR